MKAMRKVFVCECGIQFTRSQEKASHCRNCKVHKYFKEPHPHGTQAKILLPRDKTDSLASSLNISEQFEDYSVIAETVISTLNKSPAQDGSVGKSTVTTSKGAVVLPPLSSVISGEKRRSSSTVSSMSPPSDLSSNGDDSGEDSDCTAMLPPLRKMQNYVPYKKKSEMLKSSNFKSEAEFLSNLKMLKYKNVVVILGGDISEKPEFSIYNHSNGNKDVLSYEKFQEDPAALYSFLRKFYFNFHFPTITHLFLKLMNEKNILRSVYTTNIDDLEFYSGIPKQKMCQINGSLLSSYCPNCKLPSTPSGDEAFLKSICIGEAPLCQSCGNLLVPNIRSLKTDRDEDEKATRETVKRFEKDLIFSDLILVIGVNEADHKSSACTLLLNKILKVNKIKMNNDSLIFISARRRCQDKDGVLSPSPSPCLPYYFNHISTGILNFLYKLDWMASFNLLKKEFVANCVSKSFILPPKMESELAIGDCVVLPKNIRAVDTNGSPNCCGGNSISGGDDGDGNDDGDGTVEMGTIKDIVSTSVETIYVTASEKDPNKIMYLLSTDMN